ncbi:N5-glutamine methyltransferase family protein [Methylobacterium frigidaeris]|uniref:Release factor glutamine methyltransferase n=1 Tax=Methylobacterium frigidaeris TaxID=2038277 RepID=A0AA37H5S5_9HYPH|nr:class I SAM-dependent methyltransferase [Methylobacterium frigidaeris]GJD59882.1 Release factor glutamine methyltransferase [Methylobacterium frigidaeris]
MTPRNPFLAPTPERDAALLALVDAVRATGYAFTTVTPATHERVNRRPGSAEARDLRDILGWSRPFRPDVVPRELFDLMQAAGAAVPDGALWRPTLRLSSLDGELFLHSAFPPLAADSVFFGPDTMRFVRAVAAHLRTRAAPLRHVVDIGCGSGAAGIVIAKQAPEAAIALVDINEAALHAAGLNARAAGVATAVPQRSDLLGQVEGAFDLIVSNPPFMVDAAGRAYRDGGGVHGSGLSLAVVEAATRRLAPGGSLVLFTGTAIVGGRDGFRTAACELCADAGLDWDYDEVDPDVYGEELDGPAYAEADRIALAVLTATRPI